MEQAAAASCREDDREKKAQLRRPPQGFRLLGLNSSNKINFVVTSTATGDTWKTSERTLCPVCKVDALTFVTMTSHHLILKVWGYPRQFIFRI